METPVQRQLKEILDVFEACPNVSDSSKMAMRNIIGAMYQIHHIHRVTEQHLNAQTRSPFANLLVPTPCTVLEQRVFGKGVIVHKQGQGTFTYRTKKGDVQTITVDYPEEWLHIDDETNEVLVMSHDPFLY
jgi:hypothetical protein